MILRRDGSLWSTVVSLALRIRNVPDNTDRIFVKVIPSGVTAVAAGTGFILALRQDDSVWAKGRNSHGQLGDGTKAKASEFIFVRTISGAKAVAAGGFHSMVLTHNGGVWTTGWNHYGQLAHASVSDVRNKFLISISSAAKAVAAGYLHSIVLIQDGSVWAAGRNYNGQLGDGSKTDRRSIVKVMAGGVTDIAGANCHSMLLKQDSSVWTTGCNEHGQLGDGSTTDKLKYAQVVSSGTKAIAAGSRHSMVLKQDGSVWATGYNLYGQLGDGSVRSSKVFVQVISGFDAVQRVAAGTSHSMVLKQDGSLWAAGLNRDGQFGDGSTKSSTSFVRVKKPFGDAVDNDLVVHIKHGVIVTNPQSRKCAAMCLAWPVPVVTSMAVCPLPFARSDPIRKPLCI